MLKAKKFTGQEGAWETGQNVRKDAKKQVTIMRSSM